MLLSNLALALSLPAGLPRFEEGTRFSFGLCLIDVVLLVKTLQNNVLNACPFGPWGPIPFCALRFQSSLRYRSPNSLWRQRSKIDWTLTETCWASVAEFLGQTVEMSVKFFPGWSLS